MAKDSPLGSKARLQWLAAQPDEILLALILERDEDAEAVLCERYYRIVFLIISRWADNVADVEELVNDFFLRFLVSLRAGKIRVQLERGVDHIGGWVLLVAKQVWLKLLAERRLVSLDETDEDGRGAVQPPAKIPLYANAELRVLVIETLNRLLHCRGPEHKILAFLFVRFFEIPPREVHRDYAHSSLFALHRVAASELSPVGYLDSLRRAMDHFQTRLERPVPGGPTTKHSGLSDGPIGDTRFEQYYAGARPAAAQITQWCQDIIDILRESRGGDASMEAGAS